MAISLQRVIRSTSCLVLGWGFGDGGSNGAIFDSNKFKMAAVRMAISPQRLTIYLYSAHRAVIFAIAQLSCLLGLCQKELFGYSFEESSKGHMLLHRLGV